MLIRELLGEAEVTKVAAGEKAGNVTAKKSNAANKAKKAYDDAVTKMKAARKDGTFTLALSDDVNAKRDALKQASLHAGVQSAVTAQGKKVERDAKTDDYEAKNGKATPETKAEMKAVAKTIDDRKAAMTAAAKAKKAAADKAKAKKNDEDSDSKNESFTRNAKPSPLSRFLAEIAQKPKAPLGDRGKAVNAKAKAAKEQNKEAEEAYDTIGKVGAKDRDASAEETASMKASQDKMKKMKSADTKPRVKGKPQEKQEARQAKRAIDAKKEEDHEAAMTSSVDK